MICKYLFRQGELAKKIYLSDEIIKTNPKHIGIFYHRLSFGGVQRVIKNQVAEFCKKGLQVTLFVEERFEKTQSYEIDPRAKIIYINKSVPYNKNNAIEHLTSFNIALEENPVDVMIYHAGSSGNLIWDLILLRSKKIRSVVVHHESFAQYLSTLTNYGYDRHFVFKLADCLVTLTKSASIYFASIGINTVFIPNYIEVNPLYINKCTGIGNDVLCVGRLDDSIKQYGESLKIIKLLKTKMPEIKCKFVGSFKNQVNETRFLSSIDKMGLKKNIEIVSAKDDITDLYIQSKCLLITSLSEGFSLVLAEAKHYGLPVILYDLPYLDFVRDKLGVVSVDQGDSKAAAEMIYKLLHDKNLWDKMHADTLISCKRYSEIDITELWMKAIFSNTNRENYEEFSPIFEGILFNYLKGVQKYKSIEIKLKEAASLSPARVKNNCVKDFFRKLINFASK